MAARAPGRAYVGCSGWSYRHWRGTFYPPELPARRWFESYAEHFATVEVNNTFYRLPPPGTFTTWAQRAPEGFVYSLKVNRFGTHRLKLARPGDWAPAHGRLAGLLGPFLGANLVQLPPNWKRDNARLDDFLELATALEGPEGRFRWAVEFRDPSWLAESTFEILERHGAALCCHDLLEKHPWRLTTSWSYVRFHGPAAATAKYSGDYGEEALAPVARRLAGWLDGGNDVYAYFNNDTGGGAPRDATVLERLLT